MITSFILVMIPFTTEMVRELGLTLDKLDRYNRFQQVINHSVHEFLIFFGANFPKAKRLNFFKD